MQHGDARAVQHRIHAVLTSTMAWPLPRLLIRFIASTLGSVSSERLVEQQHRGRAPGPGRARRRAPPHRPACRRWRRGSREVQLLKERVDHHLDMREFSMVWKDQFAAGRARGRARRGPRLPDREPGQLVDLIALGQKPAIGGGLRLGEPPTSTRARSTLAASAFPRAPANGERARQRHSDHDGMQPAFREGKRYARDDVCPNSLVDIAHVERKHPPPRRRRRRARVARRRSSPPDGAGRGGALTLRAAPD